MTFNKSCSRVHPVRHTHCCPRHCHHVHQYRVPSNTSYIARGLGITTRSPNKTSGSVHARNVGLTARFYIDSAREIQPNYMMIVTVDYIFTTKAPPSRPAALSIRFKRASRRAFNHCNSALFCTSSALVCWAALVGAAPCPPVLYSYQPVASNRAL